MRCLPALLLVTSTAAFTALPASLASSLRARLGAPGQTSTAAFTASPRLGAPGQCRALPVCSPPRPSRQVGTSLHASPADEWQSATDESTGQQYFWNVLTGETAWTLPSPPPDAAGGSELPIVFTGAGTQTKVLYQQILLDALAAVQAARAGGKKKLQIEFPLDDKDEGKTLVKRFELLSTWAEEFAAAFGLPRVQRCGERIEIRDNVTPGGGGEYLTNEGIYGYRLSSADNTEQVLLVLLAGVDLERLNDLESLLQGATSAGRQIPGGVPLEITSTGILSSLDTVGYVQDMSVGQDATIILINTGLDKLLAGGAGFFGFGGSSKFLKSFEACYYLKRASSGFMQFDMRDPTWNLWGVCRGSDCLEYQLVDKLDTRPAFWEAEQKIKNFEGQRQV